MRKLYVKYSVLTLALISSVFFFSKDSTIIVRAVEYKDYSAEKKQVREHVPVVPVTDKTDEQLKKEAYSMSTPYVTMGLPVNLWATGGAPFDGIITYSEMADNRELRQGNYPDMDHAVCAAYYNNNWEAYLADYDIDAGGFYHNQGLAGNGQSYEDFYKCFGVNLYFVWGNEWRDGELFTNADNFNAPRKSKYLEDGMHEYKIPNSNLHYKSTCRSINDLLYNGAAYTAYNPIAWAGDIVNLN